MKNNQCKRILALLRDRKDWTPLPDILSLGCAQYNARISELREEGHNIENKTEWVKGVRYSWFRLNDKEPVKTEQESAITHNNLVTETAINQRQAFEDNKGQYAFIG